MNTMKTSSVELVVAPTPFSEAEKVALAGFLAGYSGLTREAYGLDLRQFAVWCESEHLRLFDVRRSDIERFGRQLEERGRARATIARRLCTITGFYRYATEEGLLSHSPAVHVRRPRLDYESHAIGLDRNEVGALLVAAGLAGTLVPLTLKALKLDPALASAVIVTTVTDVVGFALFLGLATAFLPLLTV